MYPTETLGWANSRAPLVAPSILTTGSEAHGSSSRSRLTVSVTTLREYAMLAMTAAASSSVLSLRPSLPNPSLTDVYLSVKTQAQNQKARRSRHEPAVRVTPV
jgi:hypothetical protein